MAINLGYLIDEDHKFAKLIRRLHVDEAHFIHTAGLGHYGLPAFRPTWGRLGDFRIKIGRNVPTQTLSGTQLKHIKETIIKSLLFDEDNFLSIKLTRSLVFSFLFRTLLTGSYPKLSSFMTTLTWLLKVLRIISNDYLKNFDGRISLPTTMVVCPRNFLLKFTRTSGNLTENAGSMHATEGASTEQALFFLHNSYYTGIGHS
jgi:hypothetical protein